MLPDKKVSSSTQKTEYLQIRLAAKEKERLKAAADDMGMNISKFVRYIFTLYEGKNKDRI